MFLPRLQSHFAKTCYVNPPLMLCSYFLLIRFALSVACSYFLLIRFCPCTHRIAVMYSAGHVVCDQCHEDIIGKSSMPFHVILPQAKAQTGAIAIWRKVDAKASAGVGPMLGIIRGV